MIYLKFLLTLSYISFICTGFIENKLLGSIVMHLDRLDVQCGGRNVPYTGYLQGVQTISRKINVKNCTIVSKESGVKKLLLTITIDRCRSKENLDTCENYLTKGNIDFCKAINPDNFLITRSPLYIPFVPAMKCPIDKKIYHGYNITLDLAQFIMFRPDGWYWKIKADVVSGENHKLLFCMYLDAHVTNSKSKTN